jgi:hypothetical protein
MAYKIIEHRSGLTPIANIDQGAQINGAGPFLPSQSWAGGPFPGDVVRAYDPVYGVGEFLYAQTSGSITLGQICTWSGNTTAGQAQTFTMAAAPATANLAQPLAVAMAAGVANGWGWFQISGNAVVATNGTLAAGPAPVYLAGSGQVTSTAAAGKQVENAINVTATGNPSAGFAIVSIDRPHAQGAIT